MPWSPPKACAHPGCGALTDGRLCEAHRRERQQRQDAARPHRAARGYDRRWHRLRRQVLDEEPLCRFCSDRGEAVAAEEVDHIDGDAWNRARDNLRPLCKACHSARTARDQAFGRGRRGVPFRQRSRG